MEYCREERETREIDGEWDNDKGATITLFWLCGQLWGIFESTRAALSPVSDVKTGRKGHPRRVYLFRTCHPRREITPISRIATNGLTTIGRFKITPNSMRIPRLELNAESSIRAKKNPLESSFPPLESRNARKIYGTNRMNPTHKGFWF